MANVFTRITNVSGSRQHLPYLPPNGDYLDAGAHVDIPGELFTQLQLSATRLVAFFQRDIDDGIVTASITIGGIAVPASHLSADEQNLVPDVASGNAAPTGLNITGTPNDGGAVAVYLNGVLYSVADGNTQKTTSVFYFSLDNGVTALELAAIVPGADLFFNGVVAGFDLDTNDRITMLYTRT